MTKTAFNLADAIQAGINHLAATLVPTFRRYGVLILVVSLALAILQRMLIASQGEMAMGYAMGHGMSFGGAIWMVLVAILGAAVNFFLAIYLAVAVYAEAAGRPARGLAWQLGTAEPPLFALSVEQATVMRAALRRILTLWPFVPAAIFGGLVVSLTMRLQMSFGHPPAGIVVLRAAAFLVAAFFMLWYIGRLAQKYLFLTPVVVETGTVDEAAIGAALPGSFPRYLKTASYWSCLGLMVAAWLPAFALSWLLGWIYEALEVFDYGIVSLFVSDLAGNAGWAIGAVFLAGALVQARGARGPGMGVAAPAAAEPPAAPPAAAGDAGTPGT